MSDMFEFDEFYESFIFLLLVPLRVMNIDFMFDSCFKLVLTTFKWPFLLVI